MVSRYEKEPSRHIGEGQEVTRVWGAVLSWKGTRKETWRKSSEEKKKRRETKDTHTPSNKTPTVTSRWQATKKGQTKGAVPSRM